MKYKILITEFNINFSSDALNIYNDIGEVYYYDRNDFDKQEIDIIVTGLSISLNNSFLSSFNNLKFIVSNTTGLNHINIDYCRKNGINIISLKNEFKFLESINATPDFTVSLVLSLTRKLTLSFRDFISKEKCDRYDYVSNEFSDLNVGIAGCGRVGAKVEKKLKYLGFKTCGFDPYKNENYFKKTKINRINDLDDFISQIDILVISISYSKKNINFFNYEKLKKLKKGSIVINTARGEVLEENALIDLLESKHISSAGLDVLSIENIENTILKSKIKEYCINNNNLLITPHIAGATYGSMRRTQEFVAKKLKLFL